MRTLMLCLLLCLAGTASLWAQALTPDALHGAWELDDERVTDEQAAAADAARAVDGFGMVLTLRTARIVFGDDHFAVGMWRLEDATETTATLVVQSRGGPERRYQITVTDGTKMDVSEAPGGLPLVKTR